MPSDNPHIVNRKAHFNYAIEEKFECGLVLKGWEVKSVRAGRVQIGDSHVYEYGGELWLSNAHMNPTDEISTHERANPTRTRKVLMHRREIMRGAAGLFADSAGSSFQPGPREDDARTCKRQA